jgi:uncharacterized membrane protein
MVIIVTLILMAGLLAWKFQPQRGMDSSRKDAALAAVVPPVVFFIISLISQLIASTNESETANICFVIGFGLVGIELLASGGFALARKQEIAKGLVFGICIAVIIAIIEFVSLELWTGG